MSKERNVTEIAMISYRDGQINIKLETYKKIFPEHWIETALTIETSKSSKLYVISREDVEAFFSLFASLNSVMEVEGLAEILDLTTWFERHESKNCPSIKQLFNVDGGDFQKVFAKMSREYVNLLGRYKNILKEKGYDEHFIVNKIEEKLQCWKDVANFINKYGSQDILQNYLFVVAYLASEIDDKEVLGEILPCLPQRYRSILRTKLVTDSITGRRKVLQ